MLCFSLLAVAPVRNSLLPCLRWAANLLVHSSPTTADGRLALQALYAHSKAGHGPPSGQLNLPSLSSSAPDRVPTMWRSHRCDGYQTVSVCLYPRGGFVKRSIARQRASAAVPSSLLYASATALMNWNSRHVTRLLPREVFPGFSKHSFSRSSSLLFNLFNRTCHPFHYAVQFAPRCQQLRFIVFEFLKAALHIHEFKHPRLTVQDFD